MAWGEAFGKLNSVFSALEWWSAARVPVVRVTSSPGWGVVEMELHAGHQAASASQGCHLHAHPPACTDGRHPVCRLASAADNGRRKLSLPRHHTVASVTVPPQGEEFRCDKAGSSGLHPNTYLRIVSPTRRLAGLSLGTSIPPPVTCYQLLLMDVCRAMVAFRRHTAWFLCSLLLPPQVHRGRSPGFTDLLLPLF